MIRNLVFEYVRSPTEAKGPVAQRIVQQRAAEAGGVSMLSEQEAVTADLESEILLDELLTVLLEDVLGIGWAFLPSGKMPSSAAFHAHLQKLEHSGLRRPFGRSLAPLFLQSPPAARMRALQRIREFCQNLHGAVQHTKMVRLLMPNKEKEPAQKRRKLSRSQVEIKYKILLQPLLHVCHLAIVYTLHFVTSPHLIGTAVAEQLLQPEESLVVLDSLSFLEFCRLPSSVAASLLDSSVENVLLPHAYRQHALGGGLWSLLPLPSSFCQAHGLGQPLQSTETHDDVLLNRTQFFLRTLCVAAKDSPANLIFDVTVPLLFHLPAVVLTECAVTFNTRNTLVNPLAHLLFNSIFVNFHGAGSLRLLPQYFKVSLAEYPHVTSVAALAQSLHLVAAYLPPEAPGAQAVAVYCVNLVARSIGGVKRKKEQSDLLVAVLFKLVSTCDLSILRQVMAAAEYVVSASSASAHRQLCARLKAVIWRTFDLTRKAALDMWYLELVKHVGLNHGYERVRVAHVRPPAPAL